MWHCASAGKDIYKARQLFSKAIDLSSDLLKTSGNSQHAAETHASFLSNRAKAHLQLGDFPAVIDDTSAALLKFEHAEVRLVLISIGRICLATPHGCQQATPPCRSFT
jgi:hypothetical protein